MEDQNLIQQHIPTNDILDYDFLRKVGLEEIQKLSGNIWTDYNYHDPGITILEIIAFALTELGYKSRYPVKDILTNSGVESENTLFPPSVALPSDPVTLIDFHKVILDIDGIKDVIIFPSKKFREFVGVYDINIELFPEYDNEKFREQIKLIVFKEAHLYRNLCEDIFEVSFIEHEPVTFEIDISVNDRQALRDIYLKIFSEIIEYISPVAKFNSLQDMLELGFDVDKIYDGPFLKSGFLTDDEFERLDTRNVVSTSDIIHFIMDIEGVEMINKLNIIDKNGNKYQWLLSVEKGKAFELNVEKTVIRFFKFGKLVDFNEDLSQDINKILKQEDNRLRFKKLDFTYEKGENRNLEKFNTIQNDFPQIYGIGELGLAPSETNQRKGQAKQLKAYLLFFEQILGNFYSQLANLHKIFSIDSISNTYYGQALTEIPGIEAMYKPFITDCIRKNIDITDYKLLKAEWKKNLADQQKRLESIITDIIENEDTFFDRRNRVLDHLLARMAFNYSDYYYDYSNDTGNTETIIKHKRTVLKEFVKISKERSRAEYFLKDPIEGAVQIPGVEFVINSLLQLSGNSIYFPFEYYENNLAARKKEEIDHADKSEFSLSFLKTTKNSAIKNFFKFGSNPDFFKFSGSAVSIVDENNNVFAEFNKSFATKELAKNAIDKLSNHISGISQSSEAIFIIERILYRPLPLMRYFTFSVLDHKGMPTFINTGYLTYPEREAKVEKIIKQGQDRKNYSFAIISNQFKIMLNDEEGNELLVSHHFYSSQENLNEAIESQMDDFKKIADGETSINDYLKFYTKHYDLFHLTKNPYSFIVTVLIPEWPEKFQNNAFLSHLVNVIKSEMPAHLSLDIKTVNVDKLLKIMLLCKEFKNRINEPELNYEELENISDELFGYFLE